MNPTGFDSIAKSLAAHRLTRRSIGRGFVGVASALAITGMTNETSAQDATPTGEDDGFILLFLQAFRSGSVTARDGADNRYILTLEQGLGHTVYFSDRPDRIVGAMPTPEFLATLGFPDDNPPNAALVVETGDGHTELAVIELFDPVYDEATHTATYDVAVLAEFERSNGFAETDADLAELLPQFGAAHLFIDSTVGCGIAAVSCWFGSEYIGDVDTLGVCSYDFATDTCNPSTISELSFEQQLGSYTSQCNARFAGCNDSCTALHTCPA